LLLTNADDFRKRRAREPSLARIHGESSAGSFVSHLHFQMKRVLAWARSVVVRALFRILRAKMPEHPECTASGPLSANTEYVAIYAEGSRTPDAIAVMRYRNPQWPLVRMSSASSSLRADGDRSPRSTTLMQDDVRIDLLYGPERRTVRLGGHEVDLAVLNLVFCEVGTDGLVIADSVRASRATLPDVRHPVHAEEALLAIAEIRAFVNSGAA
jgi:hypothetical protein